MSYLPGSGCKLSGYVGSCLGQFFSALIGELAGCQHIKHICLIFGMEQLEQLCLKFVHLVKRHFVKESLGAAIDDGNFLLYRLRTVLGLYEQTLVLAAFVNHAGGHGVNIAAEFGERFKLAELCLVDFERTCHLLH